MSVGVPHAPLILRLGSAGSLALLKVRWAYRGTMHSAIGWVRQFPVGAPRCYGFTKIHCVLPSHNGVLNVPSFNSKSIICGCTSKSNLQTHGTIHIYGRMTTCAYADASHNPYLRS